MLSLHEKKERTPFTTNLEEVHQLALALLLPRPGCGLGILLLLLCLDPAAAWGAGLHTLFCKGVGAKGPRFAKVGRKKLKKEAANV